MKQFWMAAIMLAWVCAAQAGPIVGGPTGGRLLESSPPRAEFFVNADRKVEVRFFDDQLKAVPATDQAINIIAEAPSGKARLEFENKDGVLVSTSALPEGDGYNVVAQIRATPDAKPQNFRIPLHLETCGECQRAEYACTCDHAAEGGHEGHSH